MNPLILGSLFDIGKSLIDRLFPDPAQQAAAELELVKITQSGELQTTLAQLAINLKEAESPSLFVSGWRPAVGWTCGFGLAYQSVFHNILEWISVIRGWPLPPAIDSEVLIYTLGGLLGIAGLRTYEKKSNVTK